MLIYIHGFNSSPASVKARLISEKLAGSGRGGEFLAPALSPRPAEAAAALDALAAKHPGAALVGSSLGGYYATWLAEQRGLRAVLVNPAVRPYELLRAVLGPQRNLHTGGEYEFTETHLQELEALEVPVITHPERYLLIVTTGDEVLDYRRAVERYRGCRQDVIAGGDHGFSNFGDYLDGCIAWCLAAR